MLKHASLVGLAVLALHSALATTANAQPGEEEEEPAMAPAPDPVPVEPEPEAEAEPEGPAPVRVQPSGTTTEGPPAFDATDPDAHAHTGFFGRASLGLAYGQFNISDDVNDAKLKGLGVSILFGVGYSIKPRLALHLEFGGMGLANPTAEFNGTEIETEDVTAAVGGLGGGVTYFLPSSNAYVSGSLLIGSASLTVDGDESSSDTGAALSILGGKEWWFGSDLGIGIVGHLHLGRYPDSGSSDATISVTSFALNASVTYN